MKNKKWYRSKYKAFSLIEVAVVILIIGIMIAGVFTASSLIKKARLQSAKALTQASPIAGISSTALWLESSLETSFADSENNDSAAISTWNDQNSTGNKSTISKVGAGPVYSNTINYVHAVKFSGSTSDYLKIADASYLNGTDYTIVVLEKRQSASAGFFLSTTNSSDVDDNKLELGYASDGVIAHNQNSTNYAVSPKVSAYADSTDKARLFTFVQDSTGGKKTYINGILAAQDAANTAQLSGVTTLAIGKGYTGEIGEIAIFTKALTNESRKTVEDYLGKKWTRKLNRSSANTAATGGGSDSNPTCLNGIVTEGGCDNACSTSVVTGISTPTQVNDGASGTLTCNSAAGYSGSVTYNCSNGNLNPVGSCAVTACSITGVTGFNDKTGLAYAASATAISSPCQAGYAGSPTYTCTTAGAASITGSCTPITCSITGVSGFNNTTGLAYAESATAISSACQAGYSGTPTYTCTSSGAASISGSCTTTTCSTSVVTGISTPTQVNDGASGTLTCNSAAGYSGSVTYNCSNGNLNPVGSCAVTACSITGVTGFNNATGLAYASSATAISSPCQVGYAASSSPVPSYTCTSAGAATITGSCAAITCTAAAGTGYNAKTGLVYATAGSGSFSCDAAGYTGTINYTCTSAGAATSLTGACSIAPCTGGNVVDATTVPGSTIHKFTSSGTLTCPTARSIQVLVIGGGAAGGAHPASSARTGGGGAGRMIKISGFTTGSSSTSYTVTVGNGGSGVNFGAGNSGSLSSFVGTGITLSAAGGGGGGGSNAGSGSGGGSGGGGHCGGGSGASSGTISGTMTTVTNAGNSGGNASSCSVGGGGGGGAGGAGTTSGGTGGGAGGSGISDSITGSSVIYAAGGGGSGSSGGVGGSSGVGGNGSNDSGSGAGAGTANKGSGGGGAVSKVSGAGGKGVVIVRY